MYRPSYTYAPRISSRSQGLHFSLTPLARFHALSTCLCGSVYSLTAIPTSGDSHPAPNSTAQPVTGPTVSASPKF